MAGKKFTYAPAPESRAILDLKSSYGLFIGGEFVDPTDGRTFKTVSPATEEVLAEVTEAGSADVDRAVRAARKAFDSTWSSMPAVYSCFIAMTATSVWPETTIVS